MDKSAIPPASRGDPWFDDGNIILLIDADPDRDHPPVAFKVHRGVLSRHSEIFRSMFEFPQPAAEAEMLDDCQVVRMYDLPIELSSLIKALYDGVTFLNRNVEDFFLLAGILRLSTKYFVAHLRTQAIRHLTQTWSFTLRGHDEMVELALSSPVINGTTYPYVHPLHVLNLAHEVNVRLVVPAALYFLSIYPLANILQGDHPKLSVEHPSRPSSHIALQDIKDYTLMYQYRIDVILDFIRKVCAERSADAACQGVRNHCSRVFARLAYNISQSFTARTGPFHNMMQAVQWVDDDGSLCSICKRSFRKDVMKHREKLWSELPGVVGMPSWKEMEEIDLPS
ncbi:hypothetical protein EVG20_g10491 [Dentipellis fragilis]|uniref:BTB domain-containing protein n=1 Tax=Dentipellis fragilis TaxID=205917 RepID=A0A4Y9XR85_9AGAM|nr:hypothetical protein EVG20_g10491 [Dentipellis fragilis]